VEARNVKMPNLKGTINGKICEEMLIWENIQNKSVLKQVSSNLRNILSSGNLHKIFLYGKRN
jgi:hypothetical protein